jgi:hypothetical protein
MRKNSTRARGKETARARGNVCRIRRVNFHVTRRYLYRSLHCRNSALHRKPRSNIRTTNLRLFCCELSKPDSTLLTRLGVRSTRAPFDPFFSLDSACTLPVRRSTLSSHSTRRTLYPYAVRPILSLDSACTAPARRSNPPLSPRGVRSTRAPFDPFSHSTRRAFHLRAIDPLSLDSACASSTRRRPSHSTRRTLHPCADAPRSLNPACAPPARRQPYLVRLYHDSGYRRSPSLTLYMDTSKRDGTLDD